MIATYINPYFVYGSNINLRPTFIDVISTVFQYHDKSVKLTFYQNKNPTYQDFVFDDQNNVLTFTEKTSEKNLAIILNLHCLSPINSGQILIL